MVRKGTIGRRAPDGRALRTLVLVIGLVMVMTFMTTVSFSDSVRAGEVPLLELTAHDPVEINGEGALNSSDLVVQGNGSWDNPYIIEGWYINATGDITVKNALKISNTDSHIIIRDCNLSHADSGATSMREKSGLRLVNVNNVTVINVTATINKEAGINLEACHNISISECALIGNGYDSEYASQGSGVIMKESTDVLIEGCTMTGNTRAGVTVASEFSTTVDCVNITVRDCQISGGSHGIEMSYSNDIHDLTVENCTISNFSHSGFNMHSGIIDPRQTGWVLRNLTFFDDDMTSTMGAMTLNYLTGALLEGIEVTHVNAGHINGIIDIRNSDNTTITECNFHDNVGTMVQTSYGAYDCQNITIKDCIISNCTQYGIWVDSGSVDITISGMMIDGVIGTSGRGIQVDEGEKTSRVSIQDCTITNNQQYGIYVNSYANHVDIRDCDISYNGDGTNDYGIFLSSSTNNVTVVNNTFAGNNGATSTYSSSHIQARDEGDGNRWNDSSGGNRWADWLVPDSNYDGIVDMPYNISGAVGAKDWLPLTDPEDIDPVVIITSPTEGELIDSLNVTIEWQAWDN